MALVNLTGIFVTGKNTDQEKWFKYRKIPNTIKAKERFIKFAQSKGANEINFYESISGDFKEKISFPLP